MVEEPDLVGNGEGRLDCVLCASLVVRVIEASTAASSEDRTEHGLVHLGQQVPFDMIGDGAVVVERPTIGVRDEVAGA